VLTKVDLAAACAFDEQAFLDSVTGVNPGVGVIATSARTGQGVDALLDRVLELLETPEPLATPDAPEPAPRRN
jgi:hydrogenase nickel incorporation protein HypB